MPATSCVVIPARLASTRLPRKMLLDETGMPLVMHTWTSATQATKPERVVVAADDDEIRLAVEQYGGEAVMTSPACQSGTDRVAEIARDYKQFDIFVNVQGDEPEIEPAAIDQVIALLEENPTASMATLAAPIHDAEVLADPGCVKIARTASGQALYFSRSPIPFIRDAPSPATPVEGLHLLHIGLYAYRREFLLQLASLPPSPLEQAERLEQLRALEAGATIHVGLIDAAAAGIDTIEDYHRFVARQQTAADSEQAA